MIKKQTFLDGFVPRRVGSKLGEHHSPKDVPATETAYGLIPRGAHLDVQATALRPSSVASIRTEIDESLKNIDDGEAAEKKAGKGHKKGVKKGKVRRIIKWSAIGLGIIILAVGAWVAYRALTASNSVFKGNILDIVAQNKPLKEDANGRSNILVLGTSEDDPGHQGGYLTDSIMVVSVDQKNKNAYMISVPRDLEVKYGQACISGYQGKINAYYECVGGDTNNIDAQRAALTKETSFVGGILGMDIQYGVNVNYTVMRDLVNAVGGITVDIEGSGGAPGVMDSNFDWKCGVGDRKVSHAEVLRRCPPNGHFIDYPNGPANLDAEHALYLAQARGDVEPTYGLGRSNFDRELNQQKIVKAIREKAVSAGVLSDFGRVTGIIDAIGNNLRTTFETSEVRTLISLAKDIKDQDIQSLSLVDQDPPLFNGDAQPTAGKYQFGAIQAFLRKKLSSDPVVREGAKIVVLNGSGVAGVAQTEADKLTAAGFTISNVSTAPAGTYADVTIYQIGGGNAGTKAKLESTYGVSVVTTAPPVSVAQDTNFVIILGKDLQAKTQ